MNPLTLFRPHREPSIAQAELQVYSDKVKPTYLEVRQGIGDLSIQHVALEDMRHETAIAMANLQVVEGLVQHLPASDYNHRSGESKFTVRDEGAARILQENMLLWRDTFPHYLIGERPTESPKWIDILLIGDGKVSDGEHHTPIIATVNKAKFNAGRETAHSNINVGFSEAELEKMYDPETGNLIVTNKTSGSIPIKEKDVRRTMSGVMNGVPHSTKVEGGLTNDLIELFDVEKHLFVLATAFGKVNVLDNLLAKRAILSRSKS